MAEEPESPQESQPPSPRESPGEGEAASSTASSTGSAFVSDPGPGHEPGNEREGFTAPEPELHELPEPELGWEEDTVRSILTAQGGAVHAVAGVGQEDWLYTEADLGAIAPPLTRILNRYPVARAAAGTGDEIAVIIGLGGYAMRSYGERREVLEEVDEKPEVPSSGVAADPGTGPPRTAGAAPPPKTVEGSWTTSE